MADTAPSQSNDASNSSSTSFDAAAKERDLRAESASWDTASPADAEEGDIPVLDLEEYLQTGSSEALQRLATQLRQACEQVGFLSIVGHGISRSQLDSAFDQVKTFHAQTLDVKNQVLMDRPDWPVGGVGYLPFQNRKLPARDGANLNEAFIVKFDHDQLDLEANQWPTALPKFRPVVKQYLQSMEELAKSLLPVYAAALGMPADFFEDAFAKPLCRLRMTHYPAVPNDNASYGIAPHVDTSFFTILAQDQPGLTIFSVQRNAWINAPLIPNAFIVNTGELLKQWTNDRFLSTRHFTTNSGNCSRYAMPFFFNANPHFRMECIPSCCSEEDPPKYPAISYAQSQGVVQGE